MSKQALEQALHRLRSEVEALEAGKSEVKGRMTVLIADVEHQLANLDDKRHRGGLLVRLRAVIGELEAEHPSITEALNRIMNTLSSMGI